MVTVCDLGSLGGHLLSVSGHFGQEEKGADPVAHVPAAETRKLRGELLVASGAVGQSGA